ncbi:MAG TPA: Glu/Leu/Phe/Val dehydrogenase dimerization domain-containing protein [Dehalococcoidia bacterium]|nr:Glu/Leu/Phe/Val dehydrogenase dimerization domain-containing protein [Dehalococcoidia bacterium]
MNLFESMGQSGHEQLAVCSDPGVGLKAIIAIHDTTLGPACGGTRIWPYETEAAAMIDVLRLSRAMTYKSAAADLPLGGGKAVIIADSHTQKTEALLRAFGRFVDTLGGRYLTTTDVGSTGHDLEYIRQETRHVVGLPISAGGSGDTSIMTGLGVYMGIKACAKGVWGSDSLTGKKIAMQGFGKVSFNTAHHLLKEGAQLVATDVFPESMDRARSMGIEVVEPKKIFDVECDVFSPNALGGVINSDTIPRLTCRIVAGGANNQLLSAADGKELHRRGILYAPDYVINAGGIINVEAEIGSPYNPERAREKTERIYDIMSRVIEVSRREGIPTAQAADHIAEARIDSVRGIRSIYQGR